MCVSPRLLMRVLSQIVIWALDGARGWPQQGEHSHGARVCTPNVYTYHIRSYDHNKFILLRSYLRPSPDVYFIFLSFSLLVSFLFWTHSCCVWGAVYTNPCSMFMYISFFRTFDALISIFALTFCVYNILWFSSQFVVGSHTHSAHSLTRVRDFQFENGQWHKLPLKLMKRKESLALAAHRWRIAPHTTH